MAVDDELPSRPIRAAVIIGKHDFDVPQFWAVFRSMRDVEWQPQDLENFVANPIEIHKLYDVAVFYNFHVDFPPLMQTVPHVLPHAMYFEPGNEKVRERLENSLGGRRPGILLLHHGILAFPEWDIWDDISGIKDRRFGYAMDQNVDVVIAERAHPITSGLEPFTIVDETYATNEPAEDSTILLTTSCPGSMKALAWARKYRNARVVCIQSGHDARVFTNESFRTILARSIRWLAETL